MSCTVPNLSQNTLQLGSFHLSRHNTWRWDSWIAAPPHYRRACLRVHSYCQIHPARGRCRAGRPAAQWIRRTCPSHPCSACMSRHRSWRFAWCAVERPRSQHSRLRLGVRRRGRLPIVGKGGHARAGHAEAHRHCTQRCENTAQRSRALPSRMITRARLRGAVLQSLHTSPTEISLIEQINLESSIHGFFRGRHTLFKGFNSPLD